MSIVIAITNGLGNQLWEIAYGKSLEARGKQISYLLVHGSSDADLKAYNVSYRLMDILTNKGFNLINEGQFHFNPALLNPPDQSYIIGNFQSEKYLAGIEDQIRSAFTLREVSDQVSRIAEKLRDKPSCFIHIRRGDYLLAKNVAYHGDAGGLAYYERAMLYIRQRVPDVVFYTFSDDPAWCKEHFPGIECLSLYALGKHADLYLMSQCKHSILANSSYSWWAAWLTDKPGKIVVAPSQWFMPAARLDTKDLIPSRWVIL